MVVKANWSFRLRPALQHMQAHSAVTPAAPSRTPPANRGYLGNRLRCATKKYTDTAGTSSAWELRSLEAAYSESPLSGRANSRTRTSRIMNAKAVRDLAPGLGLS